MNKELRIKQFNKLCSDLTVNLSGLLKILIEMIDYDITDDEIKMLEELYLEGDSDAVEIFGLLDGITQFKNSTNVILQVVPEVVKKEN